MLVNARGRKRLVQTQPRHNLPVELNSFVGREQELIEVERLLGTTRLLTLVGTGGIGKTRLAQRLAAQVLDGYPDRDVVARVPRSAGAGDEPRTARRGR
jgi:flagellar biosynthesis GTPase FlhF